MGIAPKEICRSIKYLWKYGELGFGEREKEIWVCRNLRWGDNLTTQSFNSVPGSRGSNQPKGKGKAKGAVGSRYNRWVNWAETKENNPSEENYQLSGREEREEAFQPDENLSLEVTQAMGNSESESDLGWGEIGKYGAGSEVGNYVLNNDQAGDYGDLGNAIGVEA